MREKVEPVRLWAWKWYERPNPRYHIWLSLPALKHFAKAFKDEGKIVCVELREVGDAKKR